MITEKEYENREKYQLVTLQVICPEDDVKQITKDMEDWYYCHEMGMQWYSISNKLIDIVDIATDAI